MTCMVAPWDSSYQFSKIIAAVELAVLDLAQVGEVDPGFRPVLQRRLLHRVKFSVSVAEGHGAGPACCFPRPDDPGDCDDVHGSPSAPIMNARIVDVKRIVGESAEGREGSGDADELESGLSGRIASLPLRSLGQVVEDRRGCQRQVGKPSVPEFGFRGDQDLSLLDSDAERR